MAAHYKLLPLEAYMNFALEAYDAQKRMGLVGAITREQHMDYVKTTYAALKKMDQTSLDDFMRVKGNSRVVSLTGALAEIEKTHAVVETRRRLEKAAALAKK